MTNPLHDDDPDASVTMPDGRVVRNLTAVEYAASYADGEPHTIPAEVLAQAETDAAAIAASREG